MLGETPTNDINGNTGAAEKKIRIDFSKAKTESCLSLHYNVNNSYYFANGKKYAILKQTVKMSTFYLNFV